MYEEPDAIIPSDADIRDAVSPQRNRFSFRESSRVAALNMTVGAAGQTRLGNSGLESKVHLDLVDGLQEVRPSSILDVGEDQLREIANAAGIVLEESVNETSRDEFSDFENDIMRNSDMDSDLDDDEPYAEWQPYASQVETLPETSRRVVSSMPPSPPRIFHPNKNKKVRVCVEVSCRTPLPDEAKFCSQCGAPQAGRHCIYCGLEFIGREKFCPECGYRR